MNKYARLFIFLGLAFVYVLLAYKNPYSTRTLVPNLEPYPDTLYYSNPAWNFVHGKGFVMQAFGYQNKLIIPPLYSVYLIPFFALFDDIRSFYFANMLLIIGSLWIFILTVEKLFRNASRLSILIISFIGFMFVTNFYLYTLPSLLMAENITLLLSSYAIYLLISPVTTKKSAVAGIMGLALVMIKFSNVPLTIAFWGIYGWRVFKKNQKKSKVIFAITFCVSVLVFFIYISITHIFINHKNLSSNAGFSLGYVRTNFWSYLQILSGTPERFLWFSNRLLNKALVIPALCGIIGGFVNTRWRKITAYLIIYTFAVVVFMSFFYTRDIRYILIIYPVILLISGIGILFINKRFGQNIAVVFMILIGLIYLLIPSVGQIAGERQIITLKKQVGLNFRHAEQPWNYNAVVQFNSYFAVSKNKKPYMGTLLPPYFINYYTNGNYDYLPISMGQEFFGDKQNPRKIYLTSLSDYYTELLKNGNEIYISPYYQNNLISWKTDYANLVSKFETKLVYTGCYDTCNIYRIMLPKNIKGH